MINADYLRLRDAETENEDPIKSWPSIFFSLEVAWAVSEGSYRVHRVQSPCVAILQVLYSGIVYTGRRQCNRFNPYETPKNHENVRREIFASIRSLATLLATLPPFSNASPPMMAKAAWAKTMSWPEAMGLSGCDR